MTFKLLATISGNDVWNTKTSDPVGDKCLCNGFSCDVRDRNRFRPTSKTIDAGQEIRKTVGRRQGFN